MTFLITESLQPLRKDTDRSNEASRGADSNPSPTDQKVVEAVANSIQCPEPMTPKKNPLTLDAQLKEGVITPPRNIEVVVPRTPESPASISSSDREKAELAPPVWTHLAENLESNNKHVRNFRKRLENKPLHSVIVTESPIKNDIPKILRGEVVSDRYGRMQIPSSSGEPRTWQMHPEPKDGKHIMFPVKGPGILPLPGNVLEDELKRFNNKESPVTSPTLAEHLIKHAGAGTHSRKRERQETHSPVSLFSSTESDAPNQNKPPSEKTSQTDS